MEFTDKEIREYVNACFSWMPEKDRKKLIKAGKDARAQYDSQPEHRMDRDQFIRSHICWMKGELGYFGMF